MATAQNTNNVNLNSLTNGQYFNNFFINIKTVGANQNDAVVAFFETQTGGDKTAAQLLASAVVATSIAQGADPMTTLQQFTAVPRGELNLFLVTFLNLNRIGTSYLGVNNQPIVNKYIQRAILA
jgi:hypothetical protein